MPAKPTVFISYRRSDSSANAGRIYDRLITALGASNVFRDNKIQPGDDFRGVIKANVSRCNVVLVVIGSKWLTVTEANDPSLRRLDNPDDWVRYEIETGLQTPGTRVIPVLVQNASMPTPDDLPPSLRELAFKNAIQVRDDRDFDSDMAQLIQGFSSGRSQTPRVQLSLTFGVISFACVITLALAFVIPLLQNNRTDGAAQTATAVQSALLSTETTEIVKAPTPTDTLSPIDTTAPTATSMPTLDLEATTRAIYRERTVVAEQVMQQTLLAENTRIVATSTLTATSTPTPSNTPTATAFVPTSTPIVAYPCPAIITGTAGALLNQVHVRPQSNSPFTATVEQASTVDVLEAPTIDGGQTWYRIRYNDGKNQGWITANYIKSSSCPD
jgi:hypothetical protein